MKNEREVTSDWARRADVTRNGILQAIKEGKADRVVADRLLGIVDYLDTLLHGFFTLQQMMVQLYGRQGTGVADQIISTFEATFLEKMAIIQESVHDDIVEHSGKRNEASNSFYKSLSALSGKTAEIGTEIYQTIIKKVGEADSAVLAAQLHAAVKKAIDNLGNDNDRLNVALREAFLEIIKKSIQADADSETSGIEGLQKALAEQISGIVGKTVMQSLADSTRSLDIKDIIEKQVSAGIASAVTEAIQADDKAELKQYLEEGARSAMQDALRSVGPEHQDNRIEALQQDLEATRKVVDTILNNTVKAAQFQDKPAKLDKSVLDSVTQAAQAATENTTKLAAIETMLADLLGHLKDADRKIEQMQFQIDNLAAPSPSITFKENAS